MAAITICNDFGAPQNNLYAEYIMRNAGLEEAQAAIKIAGRNINNLRYAQKMKIMASGPITSWEIGAETVETVSDFYLFGLQNHYRW